MHQRDLGGVAVAVGGVGGEDGGREQLPKVLGRRLGQRDIDRLLSPAAQHAQLRRRADAERAHAVGQRARVLDLVGIDPGNDVFLL